MSSPVLASLAAFWYGGMPRSEPRRNLAGLPSSMLTSQGALLPDGSPSALAAALLALLRKVVSKRSLSMIQRMSARAVAASVPGLAGSHFHAFDAVLESRGATTAYLRRPLDSPSVMRRARRGGPWLASNGLTPTKMTNSADSKSACQKNFLPPVHFACFAFSSKSNCSLIALPVKYREPWQTVVWPWALTAPRASRGKRLMKSPRPSFRRPQTNASWLFFEPLAGGSGAIM